MKRNRNKSRRLYKNGILLLTAVLWVCVMLGGCTVKKSGTDENMLGADLESEPDRVVITVTTSVSLEHFAAAVEERFPDIRLVQDSYMGDFRINEHIARVSNRDWGDLVIIAAGLIPKADLSGLLMDLSTQPFPAGYNSNSLQMDHEGHIYLLPGPLNFNCNIYNKTLFDENGWTVPESYEELITLCQTIDESGIRGFQYVLRDTSTQSYQIYNYCVLSALDTLTHPDGQTWHNQLMEGKAFSLEPMKVSFQNLQRLIDAGMVRAEDMEVTDTIRMELMKNRQTAITPGAVSILNQLNDESGDEFRFMPHFSMTDNQGWLLNLGYYFGANQNLRQSGSEKELEAAMKILKFVASEEGQQALIEDRLGIVPATRGASLPELPAYDGIRAQAEGGYYIMRPTYDMFTSVLETEIASFIRGETTSDDILEKCSALLKKGAPTAEAIGQASSDFTVLQTGLLKADALRSAAGTDIALISMAEPDCFVPIGGTRSKLYKGRITEDDIIRISQNTLGEDVMCSRASMTGAKLLELLDYGAASAKEQENGMTNGFHPFAVSGITLSYDLDGVKGQRVRGVKLTDKKELNPEAVYTVAFLDGMLTERFSSEQEKTGLSMTEVLKEYIRSKKTVSPDSHRITFH